MLSSSTTCTSRNWWCMAVARRFSAQIACSSRLELGRFTQNSLTSPSLLTGTLRNKWHPSSISEHCEPEHAIRLRNAPHARHIVFMATKPHKWLRQFGKAHRLDYPGTSGDSLESVVWFYLSCNLPGVERHLINNPFETPIGYSHYLALANN